MSKLSEARAELRAARQRLRDLQESRHAAALNERADRLEMAGIPAGRRLFESNTTPLGPTTLDYVTAY